MARILQICNSGYYLSRYLAPLVRGLQREGHEVDCACDGIDVAPDLARSMRIHEVRFPSTKSPREFARSIDSLRRLLRRERYDCTNSHNRAASIVGRIASFRERVPLNLYTAHGCYFHDNQGRLTRFASIGLEAALARITHHTLSQTREDAEFLVRRGILRASQVEVIGNGIDTRRFSPRSRAERERLEATLGLRPSSFRVISVGRLLRSKGFLDLLHAFAVLRRQATGAALVILGAGHGDLHHERELGRTLRELHLAHWVSFVGFVECVEDYLATSDAFVLASRHEGLPRAMLEAMSMALPVAVSDVRGCREVVRDGCTGYLFRRGDVEQLGGILSNLSVDNMLRERLGRAARDVVCGRYNEHDYVARQVSAIDALLNENSGRGRSLRNPDG